MILVVNVASQCGFTPQYKELAELDSKYKSKGLVILGFPCNQVSGSRLLQHIVYYPDFCSRDQTELLLEPILYSCESHGRCLS